MAKSLSNSQIERLGARLIESHRPAEADISILHALLEEYSEVLDLTVDRVRSALDVSLAFRIKNTGTILEKLRRQGGNRLRNIHDLAGMRIVEPLDRAGQDRLVGELVALFSDAGRPPRVIDRRQNPNHGYRAVHVIVFPERIPVEIQVRTRWQHEWAELFEKLADLIGRGIRYGESPRIIRIPLSPELDRETADELERELAEIYKLAVKGSLQVSELINIFEETAAKNGETGPMRDEVEDALESLVGLLDRLETVEGYLARLD